ncbi:MAG: hypothetical protein IPM17_04355 [Verrucomicrobia bacterium]|nr:hypothetical protein [Verrucomicrobiota bacterium]
MTPLMNFPKPKKVGRYSPIGVASAFAGTSSPVSQ